MSQRPRVLWSGVIAMLVLVSAVGGSAARGGAQGGAGAPAQQAFRSTVDLITINVSVRSGAKPVAGLTAADFELVDNGVKQSLDAISLESVPIDMTLILDTSASVQGKMLDRLKASIRETAKYLRADDRLRLIEIHQTVHELFALQPAHDAMPVDRLTARGATSLYDAIAAGLMQTAPPDRRQMIVAYTDGRDTTSIVNAATAREVARAADAVLHLIVPVENLRASDNEVRLPGGMTSSQAAANIGFVDPKRDDAFPDAPALRDITGQTGGQVFMIDLNDSIGDAFKRAIDDFHASYVLRYTARGVARAGWHDVGVKVTKPGRYDVRARKGYVGGGNDLGGRFSLRGR